MAASSITRVTGVHIYAQMLPPDFLLYCGAYDVCLPIVNETNCRFASYGWPGGGSEDGAR